MFAGLILDNNDEPNEKEEEDKDEQLICDRRFLWQEEQIWLRVFTLDSPLRRGAIGGGDGCSAQTGFGWAEKGVGGYSASP